LQPCCMCINGFHISIRFWISLCSKLKRIYQIMEAGASHFHISHQVLVVLPWNSLVLVHWIWCWGTNSGFWGSSIVTGCGSGSVHVYVVLEKSMQRRLMPILIKGINHCIVVFELQVVWCSVWCIKLWYDTLLYWYGTPCELWLVVSGFIN
jgi:hypothetical protein